MVPAAPAPVQPCLEGRALKAADVQPALLTADPRANHSNPPALEQTVEELHGSPSRRTRRPRMLTKKLDTMISKPSTSESTEKITMRRDVLWSRISPKFRPLQYSTAPTPLARPAI